MADPITIPETNFSNAVPVVRSVTGATFDSVEPTGKDLSEEDFGNTPPVVRSVTGAAFSNAAPAGKDLSVEDFTAIKPSAKPPFLTGIEGESTLIVEGLVFHVDPGSIEPQADQSALAAFTESSENLAGVAAALDPAQYLAGDGQGEGRPAIRLQKYAARSALKAGVATGSKSTIFAVFKRNHHQDAPYPIQQQVYAESLFTNGTAEPRLEIEIKPIPDRTHLMIGGSDEQQVQEADGWRVDAGQRLDWSVFSNLTQADLPKSQSWAGGTKLTLTEIGSDTDTLAKGSFYSGGFGVAPAGGSGNFDAANNEFLTFEFNRAIEVKHVLVENLGTTDEMAVDLLAADGTIKRTVVIDQGNTTVAVASPDGKVRIHALSDQNRAFCLQYGEKLRFRAKVGVTVLYALTLAEAVANTTIQAREQPGLSAKEFINGKPSAHAGHIIPQGYSVFSGTYTGMPTGDTVTLGPDGDSKYPSIDIREFLIYNRILTDSEREQVQRYLADRHQVAVSRSTIAPQFDRINTIVGTQQIGRFNDNIPANPNFGPSGNPILDAAHIACANALSVFKFALGPPDDGTFDEALQTTITESSLLELARDNEVVRAIFDTPINSLVFWAVPISAPRLQWAGSPLSQSYLDAIKQEWYDLAVWLRTQYNGTGRRFFMGDWEADWQLAGSGSQNPENDITAQDIADFTAFLTARQEAIDAAKAATNGSDVEVWNFTECNRGDWARDQRPGLVNSVLPNLAKLDFLSWTVNPMLLLPEEAEEILYVLDNALPPLGGIAGQPRLMLGEYYINRAGDEDAAHAQKFKNFWRDLFAWDGSGISFIINWKFGWESYDGNNYPEDSSLIDSTGGLSAIGQLHKEFAQKMGNWIRSFRLNYNRMPNWRETAKYAKDNLL